MEEQVKQQLMQKVEELETKIQDFEAWRLQKETQQLNYPLDFVSQQIIASFVQSSGANFMPLGGTNGFGIYYGSGSPNTVTPAAKGSLFLRFDGSSSSTRAYINTDGATAWTNITTAT